MLQAAPTETLFDATIAVEPQFDFLSDEYRALFASTTGTAFQAPLLQAMIHAQLAPRLNATPHTIVVRDADRTLLAVFPLMLQRSRGITMLVPADFGVCDYNTPVATQATLVALANDPGALRVLASATAVGDVMLYRKVRNDSFDISRLFPRASATPAENAAYHSEVDEDFDHWRRRVLRKHFSKELGRLGRQLESQVAPFVTEQATSPADITAAFDFLRTVRDGRFDDDLLLKPIYFDFYRDYAIAAAATGEAVTYVSRLGVQIVAVLFGMHGDGIFHAVQIGAETATLGKYSLGMQILFRTIKLRHEKGYRHFDLGLGNTGYKDHFRVEETAILNFSRPRTIRGTAIHWLYAHAKPVKNVLRSLTHIR